AAPTQRPRASARPLPNAPPAVPSPPAPPRPPLPHPSPTRPDWRRSAAQRGRARARHDRRRASCAASAIRGHPSPAAGGRTELTREITAELERDPVYVVRTPAFDGPIELLLTLAQRAEVDLKA